MSKVYTLVSQHEIARGVAKKLEKSDKELGKKHYLPGTVVKLFSTIGKFVNHFFQKSTEGTPELDGLPNSVICEVPVIGFFILEKARGYDKYDFVPSAYFLQETGIGTEKKSLHLSSFQEPILKKEMPIEKLSKLLGISEEMCQTILTEIAKTIVSYHQLFSSFLFDLGR